MEFEFSAGVIVYKYSGRKRLFLLLKTDEGRLGMPKGVIEKGESSRETALRETFEESGLRVNMDPYYRGEQNYFFKRKNATIKKRVVYYLAKVPEDAKVKISSEHVGYKWLTIDEYIELASSRKYALGLLKDASGYIDKREAIDELNKEYAKLPKKQRSWGLSRNFVPGDGPVNAKIMIVGQAPGRNEDEQRRPFIGMAGKLLSHLLGKAGLKRENVYIASVVQFFPPENRLPTPSEAKLCMPFLSRQIEIVKPRLVVLLGNFATSNVDGSKEVMKNHGKLVKSKRYGCDLYITLHPAAAVRMKKHMPVIEKDFVELRKIVKAI